MESSAWEDYSAMKWSAHARMSIEQAIKAGATCTALIAFPFVPPIFPFMERFFILSGN